MARIRTIKPEFWTDEGLARLSREARLFFVGLWNFADDSGRLRGSPSLLRSQVFPYELDVDAESLLRALAEGGFIERYEDRGQAFVWVKNFNKHQKIDKPTKSQLPAPPIVAGFIGEHSASPHGSVAVGMEGKGMEGKGAEGSAAAIAEHSPNARGNGNEQVEKGLHPQGWPADLTAQLRSELNASDEQMDDFVAKATCHPLRQQLAAVVTFLERLKRGDVAARRGGLPYLASMIAGGAGNGCDVRSYLPPWVQVGKTLTEFERWRVEVHGDTPDQVRQWKKKYGVAPDAGSPYA